jgi:hypothetical protein
MADASFHLLNVETFFPENIFDELDNIYPVANM